MRRIVLYSTLCLVIILRLIIFRFPQLTESAAAGKWIDELPCRKAADGTAITLNSIVVRGTPSLLYTYFGWIPTDVNSGYYYTSLDWKMEPGWILKRVKYTGYDKLPTEYNYPTYAYTIFIGVSFFIDTTTSNLEIDIVHPWLVFRI